MRLLVCLAAFLILILVKKLYFGDLVDVYYFNAEASNFYICRKTNMQEIEK